MLTMSEFGSYASVAELVLGLFTLFYAFAINNKVKEIRSAHLFARRQPAHLTKLDEILTKINGELNFDAPDYRAIRGFFIDSIPELESLCRKITEKKVRKQLERTSRRIAFLRSINVHALKPQHNGFREFLIRHRIGTNVSVSSLHFFRDDLSLARNRIYQLSQDLKKGGS
jgi:hypothetical protein